MPVIACGGAGKVSDIYEVITLGKADAVSVASLLHYNYIQRRKYADGDFSAEGNIEFLRRGAGFSKIQDATLSGIKEYLTAYGVECRYRS